jgi:hypothetical protein
VQFDRVARWARLRRSLSLCLPIGIGAIVAMTGVEDYISDGVTVIKLSNGHHWVSAQTNQGSPLSEAYELGIRRLRWARSPGVDA